MDDELVVVTWWHLYAVDGAVPCEVNGFAGLIELGDMPDCDKHVLWGCSDADRDIDQCLRSGCIDGDRAGCDHSPVAIRVLMETGRAPVGDDDC